MAIVRLEGQAEKAAGIYYEVDASLPPVGEGGMGKVYKGRCVDTKTGASRPVAIKFMFIDLPDQAVERARREAAIRLRNDNLIEMLGFIETDEDRGNGKIVKHYHVVSELLDGVSLSDILTGKCTDRKGNEIPYARELLNDYLKNPEHFAKVVIKNVLSGLMALHDAGYIHRDIDPSNIMVTSDRHIKLIDFGIAKQMSKLTTNDQPLTVSGAFMGKPAYASPELALGDLKSQNQTTDIYAVGILLYQCILGTVPFEGTNFAVLDKQVREKLPLNKVKDKELRRIIMKATEKKQELRYQTSAEMRVDLENFDVKRAIDPRKRKIIIGASVAAVVLIVGFIIGFSSYRNKVRERHALLIEKNYVDSLTLVNEKYIVSGDSLASIGLRHDEGYDQYLIDAKQQYLLAASTLKELKKKSIKVSDVNARIAGVDSALNNAYEELSLKAEELADDPDPIVVEEAKKIGLRAEAVKKAISKTK